MGKFLVVLSALAVAANGAPQLLYGGDGSLGYGLGAVHAVPTVAKQTIKYKTAAFEPVDAATPADATYAHAGYPYAGVYGGLAGYPYGVPLVAAAPAAEVAAEEPAVAEE